MLKNKIIIKKIRNIFILLMAIIIMLGAYHNIRNSKAENVIQVELEVADKSDVLSAQTVTVDATETSDGKYLVNLPISVNKNIVTKYYTSSGEEIEVDAENNVATMKLTDEEVANKKAQVQTDYDTKEVKDTKSGETKLLYKKMLTNEPVEESQNATQDDTENQDVIATGYMPIDAKMEVKEIDIATLTKVKIPDEKQTMQKAYEVSIYQMVEKKADESNTANDDTTNVDLTSKTDSQTNSDETNKEDETTTQSATNTMEGTNLETTSSTDSKTQNVEMERTEYDPSIYDEKITIKTKNEQTNVITTVYTLDENNKATEVESTTENSKKETSFETEKTEETVKYAIATQEMSANTDNVENNNTVASDDSTSNEANDAVANDSTTNNETANYSTSSMPTWRIENINIDKTNKKVTADLIASGDNLTGVENSTLTTDDIIVTVDGDANNVITKTLGTSTFSTNASTGLKEIKYTLTLENWEESARQAGKSFLEYSGDAKIEIKEGTVSVGEKTSKPSELFDQDGTNTDGLHIGDFVDYDAGTWTQEEINSIQTGLKTDLQTANGSTSLPTNGFQFGGFTAGSSRNGNATPDTTSLSVYKPVPDYLKDINTGNAITGWRVFDIDGDNVTLISAGNPEDYYAYYTATEDYYAAQNEYILTGNVYVGWSSGEKEKENYQKRDWSKYVNGTQKAMSAMPLTKNKLDSWFTKYTGTENANTDTEETYKKIYQEPYIKYQNVIENNSDYHLCQAADISDLYYIQPYTNSVSIGSGHNGIRMLIMLSSDVLFKEEKTGTKTITGGMLSDYGGNQTYNCWSIATDSAGSSSENNNTSKKQTLDLGQVDFINPEFTYEYANTTIDHDKKTVTVVFDVTDKYFNTSALTSDTTASKITVNFEGKEATKATKKLSKLSDITATVNGSSKKVGEKYQLVVSNLDQGDGGDYSGIMTLAFRAGIATDTSNNQSIAKTITIGVDELTSTIESGAKPSALFDESGSNVNGLHIGDFVNYDAGTWTQEEINSIQTGLKTDLQTANGSTSLPTNGFQFGGFTAGSSRNGNAKPYNTSNYVKDASTNSAVTGWRVFDIEGDTVTLISAGNPEDYYHPGGTNYGYASEYILTGNVNGSWSSSEATNYQKRDWSMYKNSSQKATSVIPLTKGKLDSWYTKYTGTESADIDIEPTFQKIYAEPYTKYQNMIENHSYYWLSAACDSGYVFLVDPYNRFVGNSNDNAFAVRLLVSLSSDVLLSSEKTGTKTLTGGNMDTYGGDQTYNCWDIVDENGEESGSTDPVIVDVVDPVWKVENVNIDKTNKKVTADLIATDKYLTGVENSTLTTDDITLTVDGDANANNVITKTLSEPTFAENTSTGLKEIKYTLTLDNWEESARQAGKSFLEYSGNAKITIKAGTVTDSAGGKDNRPSSLFDKDGTNTNGLHIGDFVDYDAGTWTQQEINSIQTGLKTNLQRANGSNSLPTNTYQFGGFAVGSSRNESAIRAYVRSNDEIEYGSYLYDTSTNDILAGWRVFDIDGDTVTLISAGNPEDYYHEYEESINTFPSEYILTGKINPKWNISESSAASTYQKRDWSVYVNSDQKAMSATPVTENKLRTWYEKYTKNGGTEGGLNRMFAKLYNEPYIKYQNIVDNFSVYWMLNEDFTMTVMRTQ